MVTRVDMYRSANGDVFATLEEALESELRHILLEHVDSEYRIVELEKLIAAIQNDETLKAFFIQRITS